MRYFLLRLFQQCVSDQLFQATSNFWIASSQLECEWLEGDQPDIKHEIIFVWNSHFLFLPHFAIYHLPRVCRLLSDLIPGKMDVADVLSYSDAFPSRKINSADISVLVQALCRASIFFFTHCWHCCGGVFTDHLVSRKNSDQNRRLQSI